MKYSWQKELIEKTVFENRIHPTAEDVYLILKANHPNISLATVYRNLNFLSENGKIKKISMANTKDRFDGETSEHYHVSCTVCDKIYDISLSMLSKLDDEVFEKTGVYVTGHELIIKGICPECSKKQS